MTLAERWFGDLPTMRIRRGAFQRVIDLVAALEACLAVCNAHPKPFGWTESTAAILREKV